MSHVIHPLMYVLGDFIIFALVHSGLVSFSLIYCDILYTENFVYLLVLE